MNDMVVRSPNSEVNADLELLVAENIRLRQRIKELEDRLQFGGNHSTLSNGIAGERIVSRIVGGATTAHTAAVDVELPDGRTIEVKYSKHTPSSKGYVGGRRWQWQKVFGEKNAKQFDYLLLIGEADSAFSLCYREPESPYVIFAVPFDEVAPLTTKGTRGARGILLLTNPLKVRGDHGKALFERYQLSEAELGSMFGL